MGKKVVRKLTLKKETLRTMNLSEMRAMAGGRTGIRMQRHRPGKNAQVGAPTAVCYTFQCSGWACCSDTYGTLFCPSK